MLLRGKSTLGTSWALSHWLLGSQAGPSSGPAKLSQVRPTSLPPSLPSWRSRCMFFLTFFDPSRIECLLFGPLCLLPIFSHFLPPSLPPQPALSLHVFLTFPIQNNYFWTFLTLSQIQKIQFYLIKVDIPLSCPHFLGSLLVVLRRLQKYDPDARHQLLLLINLGVMGMIVIQFVN